MKPRLPIPVGVLLDLGGGKLAGLVDVPTGFISLPDKETVTRLQIEAIRRLCRRQKEFKARKIRVPIDAFFEYMALEQALFYGLGRWKAGNPLKEVGPLGQPLEGELLTAEEEEYIHRYRFHRDTLDALLRDIHTRKPPVEEPPLSDVVSGALHGLGTLVFIVLLYGAFKALAKLWAM